MLTLREKSLVIDVLNASYRALRETNYSDEQKIKYEIEISNIIDKLNLYGIKRTEPYPCKKLSPYEETSKRNRNKEKAILLEAYYHNYNFIARDQSGELFVYRQKPVKVNAGWTDQEDNSRYYKIKDKRLFKQIKFSDPYPCYIREYVNLIIEKEKNEQRLEKMLEEIYRKKK